MAAVMPILRGLASATPAVLESVKKRFPDQYRQAMEMAKRSLRMEGKPEAAVLDAVARDPKKTQVIFESLVSSRVPVTAVHAALKTIPGIDFEAARKQVTDLWSAEVAASNRAAHAIDPDGDPSATETAKAIMDSVLIARAILLLDLRGVDDLYRLKVVLDQLTLEKVTNFKLHVPGGNVSSFIELQRAALPA